MSEDFIYALGFFTFLFLILHLLTKPVPAAECRHEDIEREDLEG